MLIDFVGGPRDGLVERYNVPEPVTPGMQVRFADPGGRWRRPKGPQEWYRLTGRTRPTNLGPVSIAQYIGEVGQGPTALSVRYAGI